MQYSIFSQTKNDPLKEPMFFGQAVNVSRYDQQRHAVFEQLIEKQGLILVSCLPPLSTFFYPI